MAKKIFIYDTFGVGFFICDFEGLDEDGKPRLTIMTPGCPVQNFREYTKTYAEEELDYHLLCVEGQPADSKYVVEMFCDRVAASKNYRGKDYKDSDAYDYYMKSKSHYIIHPETAKLLEKMLSYLKDNGEEKTLEYIRKDILTKKTY